MGPLPTSWTDQLQPFTINDFMSRVGPTKDIVELLIDVFEQFISDDLQEEFVHVMLNKWWATNNPSRGHPSLWIG